MYDDGGKRAGRGGEGRTVIQWVRLRASGLSPGLTRALLKPIIVRCGLKPMKVVARER